jgi:hypothetical protein
MTFKLNLKDILLLGILVVNSYNAYNTKNELEKKLEKLNSSVILTLEKNSAIIDNFNKNLNLKMDETALKIQSSQFESLNKIAFQNYNPYTWPPQNILNTWSDNTILTIKVVLLIAAFSSIYYTWHNISIFKIIPMSFSSLLPSKTIDLEGKDIEILSTASQACAKSFSKINETSLNCNSQIVFDQPVLTLNTSSILEKFKVPEGFVSVATIPFKQEQSAKDIINSVVESLEF